MTTLSFEEFLGEEQGKKEEKGEKERKETRRTRVSKGVITQEVDALLLGLNKIVSLFFPAYALTEFERAKAVDAIASECELNPYLYKFFKQVGAALPHWKMIDALLIIVPPRVLLFLSEREKRKREKGAKNDGAQASVSMEAGRASRPRRSDGNRQDDARVGVAPVAKMLDMLQEQKGQDVSPGDSGPNIGFAIFP